MGPSAAVTAPRSDRFDFGTDATRQPLIPENITHPDTPRNTQTTGGRRRQGLPRVTTTSQLATPRSIVGAGARVVQGGVDRVLQFDGLERLEEQLVAGAEHRHGLLGGDGTGG